MWSSTCSSVHLYILGWFVLHIIDSYSECVHTEILTQKCYLISGETIRCKWESHSSSGHLGSWVHFCELQSYAHAFIDLLVNTESIDSLVRFASFQGLESLFQSCCPHNISLISDGAECLFISKKVFIKHCTAATLRTISQMVRLMNNSSSARVEVMTFPTWSQAAYQIRC